MVLYTFSPGTREGERRRRICEFEVSLVYTMSSRSAKDIYIYIYSETLSQKANIPSFLSLSFFFFRDWVSLYSPGCPGTHFVDQAGLELRNPPASASQVLGLKACTTTAQLNVPSLFKSSFCFS